MAIARELGLSARIIDIIDAVNFAAAHATFNGHDLGLMIAEYADNRVTPFGVVSLEERLADLEERYGRLYPLPEQIKQRKLFQEYSRRIEHYLCAKLRLEPNKINNDSVKAVIPKLYQIQIVTPATAVLDSDVRT